MSQTAPRATFSVTLTAEDYLRAAGVASLSGGRLRTVWVGFLLCTALTVTMAGALIAYPLAAVLVMLGGGVIALTTLCLMQYAFTRKTAQDYRLFSAVFSTVQVTLWEDTLEYRGEHAVRKEGYALFSRLVESRALFVLLREDGTFLAIPKRDMPEDGRAAAFLQLTFSRKYKRTK